MILYLRTVGFSKLKDPKEIDDFVMSIINDPTERYLLEHEDGTSSFEHYKFFSENLGVVVRGEVSQDETVVVYSVVPFAEGTGMTSIVNLAIREGVDERCYSAYCDEEDMGTPMNFFLQNDIDYLDEETKLDANAYDAAFTCFAIEGTVVLPVDKEDVDHEQQSMEEIMYKDLLSRAQKGDTQAMEALNKEYQRAGKVLRERLKETDILTVLEEFFVDLNEEDEIFSVLGTIEDYWTEENELTKESVWVIQVRCLNIMIDVYINELDLIGEPTAGMRIKVTGWMHGSIDFSIEESFEPEEFEEDEYLPFQDDEGYDDLNEEDEDE